MCSDGQTVRARRPGWTLLHGRLQAGDVTRRQPVHPRVPRWCGCVQTGLQLCANNCHQSGSLDVLATFFTRFDNIGIILFFHHIIINFSFFRFNFLISRTRSRSTVANRWCGSTARTNRSPRRAPWTCLCYGRTPRFALFWYVYNFIILVSCK